MMRDRLWIWIPVIFAIWTVAVLVVLSQSSRLFQELKLLSLRTDFETVKAITRGMSTHAA